MNDVAGLTIGLCRGDEGDFLVPLSSFGGIRLSLTKLVRELPDFGPSLMPLISTGKVVMRGLEFPQGLRGTVRSLKGETVVRGNRGGARVSAKLAAATQIAARAEEASRADEANVRFWRDSGAENGKARWGAAGEVRGLRERFDTLFEHFEYAEGALCL